MKNRNKLAATVAVASLMVVALGVNADQNRFNSIKNSMSRTSSVTASSASTPSSSDFNNAVTDERNQYGSKYDDTDLKNRVQNLETNAVSKSYIDSQDDSHLNAARSYSDSAESRAKSYASSRASTAESSAKSYANSKAGTAESNAKQYAINLVNPVKSRVTANEAEDVKIWKEIDKIWAAIYALQSSGGGGETGDPAANCVHDGNNWVETRLDTTTLGGTTTWTARAHPEGLYKSGTNLMGKLTVNGVTYTRGPQVSSSFNNGIQKAEFKICKESNAPAPEKVTYASVVTNDYLCFEGGGYKKYKYYNAVYNVPYKWSNGGWVKGSVAGAPYQVEQEPDSYSSVDCIGSPLPVQP